MILAVDSASGILKIGSPPETLPGIIEFVKVNNSLLIEEPEAQGRSGRTKIVQGWDDVAVLISLSLIDNPKAGKTRWDYLKHITEVFKKVTGNGKPEIYTLSHPMINAWNMRGLLFKSLETSENRTRQKIALSLEFAEYDSASGVVQERQEAAANGEQTAQTQQPAPIVSDGQRRGLGSMEARYANI